MEEIRRLADAAAAQIVSYPAVAGKEKLKRGIKRAVLRQKLAPLDAFSWPNALLGEGLLQAFTAVGEKQYLQAVIDYLKRWKNTGYRIYYVDNIMNGSLALWIEAFLQSSACEKFFGEQEAGEVQELCSSVQEACAGWLQTAPKTGQGILAYRPQHPDWLFADTTGMVCPFLCRYGSVHKDEKMLQQGIGQLLLFWQRGMDEASGLPYHGYDEKSGMKYGIIGWGRACGWLLKGLAESLPWIPKETKDYQELETAFHRLTAAVYGYQRQDGGFSWQLEALEGHRDTSAEGMIGTALAKSAVGSPETERITALRQAVCRSVSEGTVGSCSGECKGFAEYPQIYGSYPWGTGSVLAFLTDTEQLPPADRGQAEMER